MVLSYPAVIFSKRDVEHGYRKNKSAHDAIAVTRERCWKREWVLEFDIRGLFDNIPHELLTRALRSHISEPGVLLSVER